MINFIDEIPNVVDGTPIDRSRLMDMQGFGSGSTLIEFVGGKIKIKADVNDGSTGTEVSFLNSEIQIESTFIAENKMQITKNTNVSFINGNILIDRVVS